MEKQSNFSVVECTDLCLKRFSWHERRILENVSLEEAIAAVQSNNEACYAYKPQPIKNTFL